jgi:Superinfection immunity protein
MLLGIFDGILGGTVIILVIMFLYLVPTLIAAARHRQNRIVIFNLNLLLGWTLIGWVVALVWSLSRDAAIVIPSVPAKAKSEFPSAQLAPAEEIR